MGRLAATSREPEEFGRATAWARETRAVVAEAVRDAIVENDRMGGRGEVALRVTRLIEAERRIEQALGQQQQAAELGLALAPGVRAEQEARSALRSAVMALTVASAAWVAAMDHEERVRLEGDPSRRRNGRPVRDVGVEL